MSSVALCEFIKMVFKNIEKDGPHDSLNESFEEVPLITGILTYIGFYILMIAGFVSQLFVKQNLEVEKNRDVSVSKGQPQSKSEADNFRRVMCLFTTVLNSFTLVTFTDVFETVSIVQLSVCLVQKLL